MDFEIIRTGWNKSRCVSRVCEACPDLSPVEGQLSAFTSSLAILPALSGCASSVLLLCDQEAFLDVTDKNDRTPLMIAAQGNQTAICSQLLQRGAKVDLPDKDGKTALILACENGAVEAADLLLQNGANVALVDKADHDALYYATRSKNRILRRQVRTALKRWKKRELGLFDSSETGSQVPSESGRETDVSSLAFQSEAGDQSDDEAEEGPELQEWRSRFREEKMKVIQLELQLDQKTKDCQAFSKGCQLLKEKVWEQVQEIGQLLPDQEGRVHDWRLLSRHLSHDPTEGDHCLDLLAQQVRELKERKKQQDAEKELPKASTQGGTSPTELQPGTVQWPGEEEAEELKRLRSELEAALEEKATAARRVEEMEGHMENMRAVIGVFEAKKKSQNAALKEMEARTQQLGDENRKLRGLLGKHLAGPPESSLAQAKVAQCIKEMEETQFRAREKMAAMLVENEDLKKEAEDAVRSRLQFQAVPSGAVKKCVTAWKKVVTGLEGALAKLEQACSALLDKARTLQEAILEPSPQTLVNGNGFPEEEKNGLGHEAARPETLEELQKSGVEKTQLHNGLVGQVKLRPKPEGVGNKARPCRRSSDLEKEVWDLRQSNGGLVHELAQLSREREKLQEELQKLHGSTEGSPRAEKTERLVQELQRTVEVLSHELSLEKEESGKLRLKLEEQRKEMSFVRNNFLKKVTQEAGGLVGDNLDSSILKELHWKLDNVVRKQNEALQLVSEMEEVDRTFPPDPKSPDDDQTGQEIFLEASEVIGENWRVREQMVELEKGLQEMKKLLVASQGTQGGLQVASLMQLLDRVLAQMAGLRQEEEQVLSKYEKICSMLSTRAQVLGEELAALREKYEEAAGASACHKEALDRELQKTQELMAEALEHEEEVEELRGKSQKLETTVDKLNKKVDDIARMCQERDAKIKKLLKETEKLSSEILNLRSERTRLILQNEVAQKNHQEIVAIYRTHLLNAAQGYMDEEVHAMLLRILRTD